MIFLMRKYFKTLTMFNPQWIPHKKTSCYWHYWLYSTASITVIHFKVFGWDVHFLYWRSAHFAAGLNIHFSFQNTCCTSSTCTFPSTFLCALEWQMDQRSHKGETIPCSNYIYHCSNTGLLNNHSPAPKKYPIYFLHSAVCTSHPHLLISNTQKAAESVTSVVKALIGNWSLCFVSAQHIV